MFFVSWLGGWRSDAFPDVTCRQWLRNALSRIVTLRLDIFPIPLPCPLLPFQWYQRKINTLSQTVLHNAKYIIQTARDGSFGEWKEEKIVKGSLCTDSRKVKEDWKREIRKKLCYILLPESGVEIVEIEPRLKVLMLFTGGFQEGENKS